MSFADLGLAPELLRAVEAEGYTEPTPVQAEAIPLVLQRRDVLAGAQTGTGKTAAFVLPMLQILHATRPQPNLAAPGNNRPKGSTGLPIRVLILTPTRELALQIEESVRTYGRQRPVRSTAIYGGVGYENQVRALRSGPEIVVATPGRLLDHVGQGTIDLTHVEILVLDEADRMLDMGFIRDIRRVLAILPPQRQNLLFSATFSDEIRELASGLLHDPAYVQIARRNAPIELVRQVAIPVDRERKRDLLAHLIKSGRIEQALVFTRTKHGANRLAEQLERDGIRAAAIHGNKSQGQRVRALEDFKAGRVPILVATEVAARGLDIEGLPHVVNFELPMVAEDYVHRIGRTGRAGMEGDAVSLVCIDEAPLLRDIEHLLRKPVPQEIIEGFAPDRTIRPEPIRLRSVGPRPMAARPGSTGGRGRPHAAPTGAGFAPARRPGVDERPAGRPATPYPVNGARPPFDGTPFDGRRDGAAAQHAGFPPARPGRASGRPNRGHGQPARFANSQPGSSIGQARPNGAPGQSSGFAPNGRPAPRSGGHPGPGPRDRGAFAGPAGNAPRRHAPAGSQGGQPDGFPAQRRQGPPDRSNGGRSTSPNGNLGRPGQRSEFVALPGERFSNEGRRPANS